MSAYDTDEAFDELMDDLQVLYQLKAGDTLSAEDVAALNRLDEHWRGDSERVVDAYHRGWTDGLRHAGGTDLVALQEKLDSAQSETSVAKVLGELDQQRAFGRGAQACREALARFVEQGGDHVTAASLRANWNPSWGQDPGPPKDEASEPPPRDEQVDGEGSGEAES